MNQDQIEGISVRGKAVESMEDKTFTILRHEYREVSDLNSQEEDAKVRKLILHIELSDIVKLEYIPNKTSQEVLVNKYGYLMGKWIGKKAEFETEKRTVKGSKEVCLFVKEWEDGNCIFG